MARGGINKAVVQKARQALLDRGEHPSIDAVRIELGNTGSKTTIHRYLKELDTLYPVQADRAPVLSDALTGLVGQLARQLEEEGDERIAVAEAAFEAQREAMEEQLNASRQALAALEQQHRIQGEALASESSQLETCRSTLQVEQTRNATLSQAVGELNVRLADKDEQIQSLEDKHQHARDALEHYRGAAREQREQDQRRHEAQVQQLQVEVRQMQQTLIVKQDELTRLNRDNERLLVEMRQVHKECTVLQDRGEAQAQEARTLGANLAQSLGAREELLRQVQGLTEQLAQANEQKRAHQQEAERLQQAVQALEALKVHPDL